MTTRIDWNIAKRSMLERVLHLITGIFVGHSIRFCSEHRENLRCRSLYQSMRFQTLLSTYSQVSYINVLHLSAQPGSPGRSHISNTATQQQNKIHGPDAVSIDICVSDFFFYLSLIAYNKRAGFFYCSLPH